MSYIGMSRPSDSTPATRRPASLFTTRPSSTRFRSNASTVRPNPSRVSFVVRYGRCARPPVPPVTCFQPRPVRNRWSPLATIVVASASVTRYAALTVDQCASTSFGTYWRFVPRRSVPTIRSPTRRSAMHCWVPSASRTLVSPDRQYTHEWAQPRNGLMVHGKGIADSPGTWFSALRQRTSCRVRPGNSGTCTLRSSPRMLGMPGSVVASSTSSRCAAHRTGSYEHMFEPVSSAVAAGQRSDRRAVLVERGEDDRRPRGHVGGRPDVLEETLQRVRRSYPDLEDVALHPGDGVALLDGGQMGESGRRVVGLGDVDRRDRDERGERQPELLRVQARAVAGDQPALLQAAHPLVHRRDRQTHPLGEPALARPPGPGPRRRERLVDVGGVRAAGARLSRGVRRVHGDRR